MIFVAVGTQKFQFDRLLKEVDMLIENGAIKERVFAQIGNSTYYPRNYEYEKFISKEKFNNYINKCDLLICHSGVATIMSGIKLNKPIIVVPRLAKYKEHIDDHQVQIGNSFCELNYILKCDEHDNLEKLITLSKSYKFEKYRSQNKQMMDTIRKFIEGI